jgi:hypothetical protein
MILRAEPRWLPTEGCCRRFVEAIVADKSIYNIADVEEDRAVGNLPVLSAFEFGNR